MVPTDRDLLIKEESGMAKISFQEKADRLGRMLRGRTGYSKGGQLFAFHEGSQDLPSDVLYHRFTAAPSTINHPIKGSCKLYLRQ